MKHALPLIACIFLSLAACAPKVDTRGFVKDTAWKDAVQVGQTTKADVQERFGSPSATGSYGPETWYYVASRKETVAFLKPEVVEQDALKIEFDASGVVSKVETYNKDNARDFALVKRTTPTEGHSMSFLEQTLGNIGRFNKPASASDTIAPGRHPSGGIGGR